jgi:hypothetical protein
MCYPASDGIGGRLCAGRAAASRIKNHSRQMVNTESRFRDGADGDRDQDRTNLCRGDRNPTEGGRGAPVDVDNESQIVRVH